MEKLIIAVFIIAIAGVIFSMLRAGKKTFLKEDTPSENTALSESIVLADGVEEGNFSDGSEVVFIDLETTGLDPEFDRVIEMGTYFAVLGVSGTLKGRSRLANPGISISARITELTGIDDAMVVDAKPTGEVIGLFLDEIGDRPIAAYNAQFDIAFLRYEAARIGRKFDNKFLCIMEYTKKMHPDLKRYRLQDACEAFEIEATAATGLSAHRALYDTERAMRLYFDIRRGCQPKPEHLRFSESVDNGRRQNYLAMSKYHGIRSSAKLLHLQAKEVESTDVEKSIFGYKSAIALHKESANIQIFIATSETNDKPLHAVSGDIECLNRLTMCLCKQGLPDEATKEMESYFAVFPKDAELKAAEQIRKRIAKSVNQSTSRSP